MEWPHRPRHATVRQVKKKAWKAGTIECAGLPGLMVVAAENASVDAVCFYGLLADGTAVNVELVLVASESSIRSSFGRSTVSEAESKSP